MLRPQRVGVLIILAVFLAALPHSRHPARAQGTGDYIVHYAAGVSQASANRTITAAGGWVQQNIPQLNAALVSVRSASALNTLQADPNVVYVELNRMRAPAIVPNDPLRSAQWAPDAIHVYDAWNVARGTGEVIAVLDTGADLNHPDLHAHLLAGYDFVDDDSQPMDSAGTNTGHGTHVAGITNAVTNNGVGIVGIAWDARTLPVRIISAGGASSFDIAQGIVYATDHGARVINMSLGGPGWVKIERDAVNYAMAHGVVVIAAAGNDSASIPDYPASYDHVVSVASTTESNGRSGFSNYGEFVDIAAPGSAIYSTVYNDSYAYKQGTSMAAPQVAGVAALVWSAGHAASAYDVIDALLCTSQDLGAGGRDDYFGWGLVRADQAVTYVPGAGSCVPRVAHDDFDNARLIHSSLYEDTVDTRYATSWLDDPLPCAGDTFRTVWYQYEPFRNGALALDTVGSTYDTVLAVYTGSRGTLTSVGCNNDDDGAVVSALTVTVAAGKTYYVMVSSRGYEGFGGTLKLNSTFQAFPEPGCYPLNGSAVLCTSE